jgi:hypothetical protein
VFFFELQGISACYKFGNVTFHLTGNWEKYCSRNIAKKILFLSFLYEIIKSIKLFLPVKRAAIGVD